MAEHVAFITFHVDGSALSLIRADVITVKPFVAGYMIDPECSTAVIQLDSGRNKAGGE